MACKKAKWHPRWPFYVLSSSVARSNRSRCSEGSMPTVQREGIAFHYLDSAVQEEKGPGLPLVFQHGIGGTVKQPISLLEPLPRGMRVISFDCRGHGRTMPTALQEGLSFDVFADDLVALLDHLHLPQAIIGGISMGAGVALNVAVRYPNRVAGLILARLAWMDGPMAAQPLYLQIADLLQSHGAEAGRARFAETQDYRHIVAASPDAARSLLGQFDEPRAVEAVARPIASLWVLKTIRAPVLVLATRQDPVHPFIYAETLA